MRADLGAARSAEAQHHEEQLKIIEEEHSRLVHLQGKVHDFC
jgi:hypothetical protein